MLLYYHSDITYMIPNDRHTWNWELSETVALKSTGSMNYSNE